MGKWVDELMGRQTDEGKYGGLEGGWVNRWMEGLMNRCIDGCMNE